MHRVHKLFEGLKPRSYQSVKLAMDVWENEGIAATMVVRLPAKAGEPPEVFLTTAPAPLLVTDISKVVK